MRLILPAQAALAVLALVLHAAGAVAGALQVTEPDGFGDVVREGLEFATDVMDSPWDMDHPFDVVTSESSNLVDESIDAGVYRATTATSDAGFFLLHSGIGGSVFELSRGQQFPIDTGIYRYLTVRIRYLASPTATENLQVFYYDEFSCGGCALGFVKRRFVPADGRWHVVTFDLPNETQPNTTPPTIPWDSFADVRGLRLDPSDNAGTTFEIDWVRLTAQAPVSYTVRWEGDGSASYDVVAEVGATDYPLASGVSATQATVDLSPLHPGFYRIRVDSSNGASALSPGAVRVNQTPIMSFQNPDLLGDVDQRYSLMELANPWGPFDALDIDAVNDLTNVSYGGGVFRATSTGGDASILFNTALEPIDTAKYRMLSYRMRVSGARDIGAGSVARIFWGTNPFDAVTSDDVIVQEGMNTYPIGDLRLLRDDAGTADRWTGIVSYFRIDPHEFPTARDVELESVILAPLDAADPVLDIEWTAEDPDGTAAIRIMVDDDRIPEEGDEILVADGLVEDDGAGTLSWNGASAAAPGEYQLYAVVDDGLNANTVYATAPFRVGTAPETELAVVQPDGVNDEVRAAPEFSRDVEGNAWNMADDGDVPVSRTFNVSGQSFAGGRYSGRSTSNDPAFWLLFPGETPGHVGTNGTVTPVRTADYSLFNCKIRVSGTSNIQFFQLFFTDATTLQASTLGRTVGVPLTPGEWELVSIDLNNPSNIGVTSPFAWRDKAEIVGLRVDPVGEPGVNFEIDWCTLTRPSAEATFDAQWSAGNFGNSTFSVSVVDGDGFEVELASGLPASQRSATLDLSVFPYGDLFVRVAASPGGSTVSAQPLTLGPRAGIGDTIFRDGFDPGSGVGKWSGAASP